MKTKYIFGSLALAAWLACSGSLIANPLNSWHWRNPLPNGNPQLGAQPLNGVAFANGTFFAVGNSGVVDTSLDTSNWTQTVTATSNQLNAIIYAGGKFVAVGNSGTVETSSDGTNWVLQNSGTTSNLDSIAYGNGKFTAVGAAVISSRDAVNWSPAVSGLSSAGAVAGSSFGFVAVGGNVVTATIDTNAYFSTDGMHWAYHPLTAPASLTVGYENKPVQAEIVTFFNGSFLIGALKQVTSGSYEMYMYSSTDGSYWTTNDLGNEVRGFGSFFYYAFFLNGSSRAIAAGYASVPLAFLQFSPDGINWTQTNNLPGRAQQGTAGVYGNGYYVIVGSGNDTGSGIWTSRDALNWTNVQYTPPSPVGPTSTFNSIAYSNGTYVVASSSSFVVSTNDAVYTIASNTPSLSSVVPYGTNFVAVGSSGQIYTSTNGFSWTQRNSGTANNLHSVTVGNNLLVAVGDSGTIQTSPTGIIWTSRPPGTSLALYGVTYSNGLYVAVGQQGTVVTSSDGTTWQPQDSTVLNNLLSVTYGSAGFLAVGTNSTIVTSPDGINWVQQNPGVSASFNTATYGNGYYLIAGKNAVVLTSPDAVNWTSRNVGVMGGQTFYGSGFFTNRFDLVGANGTVVESDQILLIDFQIQRVAPKVVITATVVPGTTFRIQSCSSVTGPGWTTVATFNNAPAVNYWTNSAPAGIASFYRLVSP